MTDELAGRRVPEWARKLAGMRLGASFAVVVVPHGKWVAENPGAQIGDCPEHLLEVSIRIIGAEIHPAVLAGQQDQIAQFPVHELCRVPWPKWREAADAKLGPAAGVVA